MEKTLLVLAIIALVSLAAASDRGPVRFTYYGQSCFLMVSPGGTRALMDPYNSKLGYKTPPIEADLVTISHEHFDHNNAEMAKGAPRIIRGIDEKGEVARVSALVGDVKVYTVASRHWDDEANKARGNNAIMVFETGGKKIAHLGDLGEMLGEEQAKQIGRPDILLIPVGGHFTIDAGEAAKVIDLLKPAVVIPMHFKTGKTMSLPIAPVDDFLRGRERVERKNGSEVIIDELPEATTIMVLKPEGL